MTRNKVLIWVIKWHAINNLWLRLLRKGFIYVDGQRILHCVESQLINSPSDRQWLLQVSFE